MKNVWISLLLATMLLGLAACGDDASSAAESSTSASSESTSLSSSTPSASSSAAASSQLTDTSRSSAAAERPPALSQTESHTIRDLGEDATGEEGTDSAEAAGTDRPAQSAEAPADTASQPQTDPDPEAAPAKETAPASTAPETPSTSQTAPAESASQQPAAQASVQAASGLYLDSVESSLVNQINNLRALYGLSAVSVSDTLHAAARTRASELLAAGMYAHTRPNGSSWDTVLTSDYGVSFNVAGENLSMSAYNGPLSDLTDRGGNAWSQLVNGCMDSWQRSSSHFGLLTDQVYHTDSIGLGVAVRDAGSGVDVMICCIMTG